MSTDYEAEFLACAQDFTHFCEHHVKVAHPKHGLVPLKLHDFQKRYAKAIGDHRFLLAKKFRQGGFTTVTLAYALWRCLFKTDQHILVLNKTDRMACWLSGVLRQMLRELPDWISTETTKCTDHEITFSATGSQINFFTPEATCGRAADLLFIDEAAFIKDMDLHWKALWFNLNMGGNCVAISTPNGRKGWFYQTWQDAQAHKNTFFPFTAEYHEHPEYNDPAWRGEMMKNLGHRGWRQEILAEFLEEKTPDRQFKDGEDFLCEVTAAEEAAFITAREKQFKEDRRAKESLRDQQRKSENFEIKDNPESRPLVFDEEVLDMGQNVPPTAKPEVHHFKQMTKDEIRKNFEESHKDYQPDDSKHPIFSGPGILASVEETADYLDQNGDSSWLRRLRRQNNYFKKIEDRIERNLSSEMLCLSGVITTAEVTQENCTRPDIELLEHVHRLGDFGEDIELDWLGGRLCVNEAPTCIREEDVQDAYNGLASITSPQQAMDHIGGLLKDKLKVLFGKEPEWETSSTNS